MANLPLASNLVRKWNLCNVWIARWKREMSMPCLPVVTVTIMEPRGILSIILEPCKTFYKPPKKDMPIRLCQLEPCYMPALVFRKIKNGLLNCTKWLGNLVA
mmetsp:Transcript_115619/g.332022  ORF Transcript_115619/g.332022 Transcript_115619/m.332022 type:complete len:102 (+) Transcript_115619:37-342(+)